MKLLLFAVVALVTDAVLFACDAADTCQTIENYDKYVMMEFKVNY